MKAILLAGPVAINCLLIPENPALAHIVHRRGLALPNSSQFVLKMPQIKRPRAAFR
jgi:hypothetical protein